MPKYRNKTVAKMKKHQVEHLTEQYAGFLDDMDEKHNEYIQQVRDDHKAHKARLIEEHEKQKQDLLEEAILDVRQHDGDLPKEIAPGIVVMPGDYYVEEGGINGPFGIAAADIEANYERV